MGRQLTVYYNTKCPVCNTGIEWQRHRLVQAARAGIIEFRDINLEPDALARFGAGLEDVRRRLHAVDADGRLQVGAPIARSRSSSSRRATLGWRGSSACRRSGRSHASSTTASPICSMPGTAARDIGERMYERGRPAFSAFKRALPASCRAPFFPARFRRTCTGRRAWMSFR
jgi:hypothetical protein